MCLCSRTAEGKCGGERKREKNVIDLAFYWSLDESRLFVMCAYLNLKVFFHLFCSPTFVCIFISMSRQSHTQAYTQTDIERCGSYHVQSQCIQGNMGFCINNLTALIILYNVLLDILLGILWLTAIHVRGIIPFEFFFSFFCVLEIL